MPLITKFKVTSGLFKRFVHVQMLIDEMEQRFGVLNVRTRTDGLFIISVYITLVDTVYKKIDQKEVEAWWASTDKSGDKYKIELFFL